MNLCARVSARASDYHWDQSFFALLDTELINEIPDNQRYITHPSLSQHHLANREQLYSKLDAELLPQRTLEPAARRQLHGQRLR